MSPQTKLKSLSYKFYNALIRKRACAIQFARSSKKQM